MKQSVTIALLDRIKEGDTVAFDLLFDECWEGLYRYALKIIANTDDAEDIVQELFCELWERREKIAVTVNLQAYLFGILRKKIIRYFRDSGIHQKHLEILYTIHSADNSDSPLTAIISDDLVQNLRQHLTLLPHREREVFVLNQIDGYSIREISERFQTSEQTVRNQVNNATRKMMPLVAKLLSGY